MSKEKRRNSNCGTTYATEHESVDNISGRKLRRLAKYKPHLLEAGNNIEHLEGDVDENGVIHNTTLTKKTKNGFSTHFKQRQEAVKAIDPIWFEWVEEAVHLIGIDILKSLRNLAIIGSIIAIIAKFV